MNLGSPVNKARGPFTMRLQVVQHMADTGLALAEVGVADNRAREVVGQRACRDTVYDECVTLL